MIGVGLLVGFRFAANAFEILAGVGLMLLFGYAFSWIFAFVGLIGLVGESAQAIGFIGRSSRSRSPRRRSCRSSRCPRARQFAEVNPFTTVIDAMRALWLDAPAGNDIWMGVVWSLGLIAVFAPLAVARYRKATSRASTPPQVLAGIAELLGVRWQGRDGRRRCQSIVRAGRAKPGASRAPPRPSAT